MSKYNGATCRGSYLFGSACGHCERCKDEMESLKQSNRLSDIITQNLAEPNAHSLLGDGWRDARKELPDKRMRVWACWGERKENVDEMEYVIEEVRGKEKRRFYWRGRLTPWEVLYWQPYYKPDPPDFT